MKLLLLSNFCTISRIDICDIKNYMSSELARDMVHPYNAAIKIVFYKLFTVGPQVNCVLYILCNVILFLLLHFMTFTNILNT